jgi:hypothetical protein
MEMLQAGQLISDFPTNSLLSTLMNVEHVFLGLLDKEN